MQKEVFNIEEKILFQLIEDCLKIDIEHCKRYCLTEQEWRNLVSVAEKHKVLSILYPALCGNNLISELEMEKVEAKARQTVLQQYHLLFFCKYLTSIFQEQEIPVIVLKGVTIGSYYPVPELRKSGDVDLLLLNPKNLERAKAILIDQGFTVNKQQHALHHLSFSTSEGIEIELHTMLAEPFDNEKTNLFMKQVLTNSGEIIVYRNVMGVILPVLSDEYYALELLLHMLQHFLRSGFGLKLLCDWVVFWRKSISIEAKQRYLELVEDAGLKGFSDIITLVCVKYLGMEEQRVTWMNLPLDYPIEAFMRETLDAEEFGKSNKNRMVVMRGIGLFDYVREFHHQMRLNYPKAGKCVLFWPVLWMMTLMRFLRNNRKLRKISTGEILKEAARRSRLMKEIHLYK